MKHLLFVVWLLIVFAATYCTIRGCENDACAEPSTAGVEAAILKLQPSHTPATAAALAPIIVEASRAHGIDPLLVVALAMRESSLIPGRRGRLGERGLLQVHGVALSFRPAGCGPGLETTACEVGTGVAYLAWVRSHCGGSRWAWVCSYGRSSCCSIDETDEDGATRRAKAIYGRITHASR